MMSFFAFPRPAGNDNPYKPILTWNSALSNKPWLGTLVCLKKKLKRWIWLTYKINKQNIVPYIPYHFGINTFVWYKLFFEIGCEIVSHLTCQMSLFKCHTSYFICPNSHVSFHMLKFTCYISHVTFQMSYFTYHISHVPCHISQIAFSMSHFIFHMSQLHVLYIHFTCHISHVIFFLSYFTCHISHVTFHM